MLVVALGVSYYIAQQFQGIAEYKGYSEKKYLWICFFLGIPGYLLVIALPDRNAQPTDGTAQSALHHITPGERLVKNPGNTPIGNNSWYCSCGYQNNAKSTTCSNCLAQRPR